MPYHREIDDEDKYVVYVIDKTGDLECEIDYYMAHPEDSYQFINSYIGVTHRPYKRFQEHNCLRESRKPAKVCYFVTENKLNFEENMRVIFEGTQDECKTLENLLRPKMRMGQNVAIGGGEKRFRVNPGF